jgi:hypothetical protein
LVEKVSLLVGISGLTSDQVNELKGLPEVTKVVNDHYKELRAQEQMPDWAKEAKVTTEEWGAMVEAMRAIRAVRREEQEARDAAAAEYKAKLRAIEAQFSKKLPVVAGNVAKLVEANTATFSSLPLNVRARVNLECAGKDDDHVSVIRNNALAAYRGMLFRA